MISRLINLEFGFIGKVIVQFQDAKSGCRVAQIEKDLSGFEKLTGLKKQ